MKRKRFTEEQIIGVLKEERRRARRPLTLPGGTAIRGDDLQLEGQIWRVGGVGGDASD
jgi:hypothetical protein